MIFAHEVVVHFDSVVKPVYHVLLLYQLHNATLRTLLPSVSKLPRPSVLWKRSKRGPSIHQAAGQRFRG